MKEAAQEKVDQAKETGTQLAADASNKVEEVKDAANEKVEEVKEAGAQLAENASEKADETKQTIVEAAVHAKDVAVEKVQEFGNAVNTRIDLFSV